MGLPPAGACWPRAPKALWREEVPGRAFLRLRARGQVSEEQLADAGRELDALWARCEIWELTPLVCEMACQVAPTSTLRTLDALHLATYLLARRRIADLELLTADQRLLDAARGV